MIVYAIYFNASDFPDKYVVRKWYGNIPDDEPLYVGNDLLEARNFIPNNFIKFPFQDTDSVIIEQYF